MENILREADETKRTRMRALLKGLVYTGGGRLAIRAAFGPTPEPKEEKVATMKAKTYLIKKALSVPDVKAIAALLGMSAIPGAAAGAATGALTPGEGETRTHAAGRGALYGAGAGALGGVAGGIGGMELGGYMTSRDTPRNQVFLRALRSLPGGLVGSAYGAPAGATLAGAGAGAWRPGSKKKKQEQKKEQE